LVLTCSVSATHSDVNAVFAPALGGQNEPVVVSSTTISNACNAASFFAVGIVTTAANVNTSNSTRILTVQLRYANEAPTEDDPSDLLSKLQGIPISQKIASFYHM
jgi:hypothetical protein